ncbi:lysine decarboxylase [Fusarium acutatum]|uniref:Lysine decarboxylase n=1 Tax=Fusarium acutatum TaxID=78861 RepID=A0A8H4NM70_9HYPO|nr:lysine decarboxylase [Fusarium acutatum]
MEPTNRFMIGVFGPTGAGKTKLGVSIAKSVHGQVISIDSLQCYSPGSIITAKPTPEETDGVDHHMIGYLEADEEPTNYVAEATKRLEKLYDHGVIPVVVGGSTSLTLPLLHDALKRGWRMAAITLLPHQSTYLSNIESRLDDMVEAGLLEELSGLKLLEDKHLNGKPNFQKGIWKAIGYQELYPYLQARKIDGHCDQLLKTGLASMKENTFQYGITQLEWIRQALCPFLHAEKIANMSLTVVDKTSWISDVEKPAIRMASDFCHASTSISFHAINGSKPRVLCIFGGSSSGNDSSHIEAAKSLGRVCHENNIKLVYGGGTTGVMGAIASTLVELSGPNAVHGIIPEALLKYEAKELGRHPKDPAYARYGKQTVVKDMHTRKRLMIQEVIDGGEGSGFVGLSGGYGTLEELFEVITWHQLGIHDRGICLLNTGGFFDGLVNWLGNVVQEGFIGLGDAAILGIASTAEGVVKCLDHKPGFSRKGELEWV